MIKLFGSLCLFLVVTQMNTSDVIHNGLSFRGSWPEASQLFLKNSVTLTCEYSGHSPSSLSIFMKNNTQRLPTQAQNNELVYRIESLQCKDMGTYICQYENNTDESSMLDVPARYCAPQLCPEERQDQERIIYVQQQRTLVFSICLITNENLVLQNVFLNDFRKTLPTTRYTYQVSDLAEHRSNLYHRVNMEMYGIEPDDYGTASYRFHSGSGFVDYEVELVGTGLTITEEKSHEDHDHHHTNEPFSLTCESTEHPPALLSILLKNSIVPLPTKVLDNTRLVFEVGRLQCKDMGTYVCQYNENPAQKVSVDVPIEGCPPRLCPGESETRTIYADLNTNISVSFCIIANEEFHLQRIFLDSDTTNSLPEQRYTHKVSKQSGQDLYYNADIWMCNVQKDDYGVISFRFDYGSESVDYDVVLKETGISIKTSVSHDLLVNTGQSLSLICESSDHPPTSLRINVHGSDQELKTEIRENTLTYSIENLQCRDMGAYTCQYSDHSSQRSIDIPIEDCGPQLCPEESHEETVNAMANDNVTVSFCIIAHKNFDLFTITVGANLTSVSREGYEYTISKQEGHELYHAVSVVLYRIQEDDFGMMTITLMNSDDQLWGKRLEYRINLEETEGNTKAFTPVTQTSPPLDQTTLHNATIQLQTWDDASNETTLAIVIAVVVVIAAVVVTVTGIVCVCVAFKRLGKLDVAKSKSALDVNAMAGSVHQIPEVPVEDEHAPLTAPAYDKDAGRYISREGLTYVTIDHGSLRNHEPKRAKQKRARSIYNSNDDLDQSGIDGRVENMRLSEILNSEYVNVGSG